MRIAGYSSISISSRSVHPHADTINRAFAALSGEPQPIAMAGRYKSGHNRKSGAQQCDRKIVRKAREDRVLMVSAAGFEPATHALKVHFDTTRPCVFNALD